MSAGTKSSIKELFDDPHDVIIKYTAKAYIAALYDRTQGDIGLMTEGIKERCPSVTIRVL